VTVPDVPKGPMTVEALLTLKDELLRSDPEYRRQVEAAASQHRMRQEEFRRAQQPIVADLRASGTMVDSVWDLVKTSEPYPAALPILLEHFERGGYPDPLMESIGRALAVKPSVQFWDRLKNCWLRARGAGEEDGAAVALAAAATRAQLDDLIGFLSNEERGNSRIYFIRPILRVGGERGRAIVEALREDPVFGDESTALLKRRRKK